MPAQILDGRAIAADLRASVHAESIALRERAIHPRLIVTLVGEDEASAAYVRNLLRVGQRTDIKVEVVQLRARATENDVRTSMQALAYDASVHGVLLQQPLPSHLCIRSLADAIPPQKDVDGANPINQGRLAFGSGTDFVPATAAAVMLLLERSPAWPIKGKRAAAIGRSNVVGLPVALLLLAADATVTVFHKESRHLSTDVKTADVVVVATGVPGLVDGTMVKPGATVIDVGTTLVDGTLRGDVDFASVRQIAGAITPVPGGVGPVTNIALLRNVIKAATSLAAS
ncbi:MAG: bifunctional 5,10-methylenetetrahydrofolate dehydrogenase/5,10-methenyltetrahydrofolate cyclohydrolase [Candidatus Eremiobacteraeota bacterium]|nr:bifunctional 5,10-methylenetetrahydrofolate dehydrogenase/5,10-methenyltetrahydrofolate cyclohydrolase [Candidatus Eremiobacteraeota bacterium]